MPMPVTHDDLSLRKAQDRRTARASGQVAICLVGLSVLCGLVSFILCLAAEASRSEVSYYLMNVGGNPNQANVCVYNSSGRNPLGFAIAAFVLLAIAMFAEHAHMLLAVAVPESSSVGLTIAEDHPRMPATSATLTWQACFLFFITWICFGLAEVLLMIGIGVESVHVSDWRKPRPVCHKVRPGMFAAAGILGLTTVVVGFVVYVTAVQTNRLRREGGHVPHHGAAPHPGFQHHHQPPLPHHPPAAPPTAPPQTTTAACQVQPSQASTCVAKVSTAV